MSSHKKKLLIVTPSVSISGGRERVMSLFAQNLHEKYDLLFIVMDNCTQCFFPMPGEVKIESIDSYMMRDRAVDNNKLGFIGDVFKIRKCLKRHSDRYIVISTDPMISIYIGLSGLAGKRYFIAYEHVVFDIPNRHPFWTKMRNVIYSKLVKKVVTLTEQDGKKYAALGAETIVIPNALTFSDAEKAPQKNTIILSIGRFTEEKGFDTLLRSFALMADKSSGWMLKLIGSGPMEEYLRELIISLRIQDRVMLEPPTTNIREKYMEAAFYVLSSKMEGFPMVLLEAMAHGLPAVSFDCETGPREIIHNGEDGILVPPGNIQALADQMLLLVDDPELRTAMGQKAFKNIRRFSPEFIFRKWQELLDNISDQ